MPTPRSSSVLAPPQVAQRTPRPLRRGRLLGFVAVALVLLAAGAYIGRPAPTATAANDRTWILHFQPTRADAALPVYRDLLRQLSPDVACVIAVNPGHAQRVLEEGLGARLLDRPGLSILPVEGPLGPWARDRFLAFVRDGQRTLYLPPERDVHPMERASLQVPRLMQKRDPSLTLVQGPYALEGGDVLFNETTVFVGAPTVARCEARRPGFRAWIETLTRRRLAVVGTQAGRVPYDHIDMFLTPAGGKVLLLGDPRLALELLGTDGLPEDEILGRFSRTVQERVARTYDALRDRLERDGFRVRRIPILHGERFPDGRRGAVLNWNNAVVDPEDERVYLPTYGVPKLDAHAAALWRTLGYEVATIDARMAIVRGGAVRCLTNGFPGVRR